MSSILSTTATSPSKTAVVLGVANGRSIAWACVRALLERNYRVVLTYQNDRVLPKIQPLLDSQQQQHLHALPCNVETDVPRLFQELIPELLLQQKKNTTTATTTTTTMEDSDITSNNSYSETTSIDAIVHSIAYAPPDAMKEGSLLNTSREAYLQAHSISAYSFLEVAREARPLLLCSPTASLTALTYIGSVRAVPNYNVMGPAKASLESLVRGLALEMNHDDDHHHCCNPNGQQDDDKDETTTTTTDAHHHRHQMIRVNAVSAGPIKTLAGRGIRGFSDILQDVRRRAPLRRNVTAEEVAEAVAFLASPQASGITGQVLHVDAGYGITAGPPPEPEKKT